MNEKEENNFSEKHRQYMKARMKECLHDAAEIVGDTDHLTIMECAIALFDKRVSQYHYYKQNEGGGGENGNGKRATEKQKAYLTDLGVDYDEDITRDFASELLTKAIQEGKKAKD